MTVSLPDHPVSDDPLASERLAMVGQLVVAQFDLETVIAALMRSGGNAALVQTQLQNITELRQQVGTASPAALATLRGEISAAIAQSQTVVQEARAAASGTTAAGSATLASLAATSRDQVQNLMRDMHQFDGELEFASTADQTAYREREAQRRAIIEAELAKNTPEGNLNAAGATVGQMADAKAHGANSPAFQQRWNELAVSTQKLRDAIIREGGDVAKFDARLRDDFRSILKAKGLSDAQIEARLAAHRDNPLEAVKAYMAEGNDISAVEQSIQRANTIAAPVTYSVTTVVENEFATVDPMAEFRAAGIMLSDHVPGEPFAHGVSTQEPGKPSAGHGNAI